MSKPLDYASSATSRRVISGRIVGFVAGIIIAGTFYFTVLRDQASAADRYLLFGTDIAVPVTPQIVSDVFVANVILQFFGIGLLIDYFRDRRRERREDSRSGTKNDPEK